MKSKIQQLWEQHCEDKSNGKWKWLIAWYNNELEKDKARKCKTRKVPLSPTPVDIYLRNLGR